MFAGGAFSHVGGRVRSRVAAFGAGGALLPWGPAVAGGTVEAIAVSPDGGTVYVGGSFTSVAGASRSRLAALNATTGALLSWNPGANGTVEALVADGSAVYAGGTFESAGGGRGKLAAISRGTGRALSSFSPRPNSGVFALALSGQTLYVGGRFTTVGGLSRPHLASVMTSGRVTSWAPTVHAPVNALVVDSTRVYAGLAGGKTNGNGPAAFSRTSGGGPLWLVNGDGNVQSLALIAGTLYVGGHFAKLGGSVRHHAAAVTTTGTLTSWAPTFNSALGVWSMLPVGAALWVGGDFTTVNGAAHPHLVRFS